MKITDMEVRDNQVKSAPDTLKAEGNTSPRDIKHIFDKLPELIVQKFNAFVDFVTAEYYTKSQTESAISERVVNIGASDMTKAVYDKNNDGVVDKADTADALGGVPAECFASKTDVQTALDQLTLSADKVTAGVFAGNVAAYSVNRDTACLRNIEVRADSTEGALQYTNKIIVVRK